MNQPARKNRLLLPLIVVALPLIGIALYLRTAPARAERALRNATYNQLVEVIKQDPGNSRALYYFGLRNRDLGRIGPARAALAHAAHLDPDSEEIALAWANIVSEAGGDQESFQILTDLLKRHPHSTGAHWALALFYAVHSDPARSYREAIAATAMRPQDAKAWRLAGVQALGMRDQALAEAALRRAVALDPKDWRSQFALGETLTNQSRDADALAAYQAAASLAPDEPTVLARLGRAQLGAAANPDDLRAAVRTLTRALQLKPDTALAQLSLGQAQLRLGDYSGAKRSLLEAERLAPALYDLRSNLHFSLVQVDVKLNDLAGSAHEKRLLREATSYEQGLDRVRTQLMTGSLDNATCLKFARLCTMYGDRSEAAMLYRQLLNDPASSAFARQQLAALGQTPSSIAGAAPALTSAEAEGALASLLADADALLQKKQVSQAADAYRAILKRFPNSAIAWQDLGSACRAMRQNDEAFHAMSRALTLQPDLTQAQFVLAALYFDYGLPDEAARRLKRLIQTAPPKAEYFNALGDCQRDDSVTYVDAEPNYRRAAELDPHQPDYRINLADEETLNNKLQAAEKDYRLALTMAPESTHAQLALGKFLLRQQATPATQAEAERLLRSVLKQQPKSAKTLLALGSLLTQRGEAQPAVPLLEQAVLLAPNQQDSWYNLARAYNMLHNKERSQYCYAQFHRISDLNDALDRAQDQARSHPGSAEAHLKLARLYANANVNAKALNQYQVAASLEPNDASVRQELQNFTNALTASGRMPDMGLFNDMVASSVKFH